MQVAYFNQANNVKFTFKKILTDKCGKLLRQNLVLIGEEIMPKNMLTIESCYCIRGFIFTDPEHSIN